MNYATWRSLLQDHTLPCAIVDLDAVDHNLRILHNTLRRDELTLRVASKSIRIPWLLRYLLDQAPTHLRGLMTYSARETHHLATHRFDDLLLAYPPHSPTDIDHLIQARRLTSSLTITVDHPEHIRLLATAAQDADLTLDLCLDLDVSWRPMRSISEKIHIGVRRSPIRTPDHALALADLIASSTHLRLTSLLAYEAQVAGLPDHHANPALSLAARLIKQRSIPLAAQRRAEIAHALRARGHQITLINGGGTGSLHSTCADPTVTEVTAGSGFLCPHLFERYHDLPLRPASFFALPICRISDPSFVTCYSGGFIASGATSPDRSPIVHSPSGLKPVSTEGWGEVQTPLSTSPSTPKLAIGDPVIARHAKSGEPFERFNDVLLIRQEQLVKVVQTYRGLQQCFS
jgi:D-serine deaminase-like pyridoxal phosphate-dependent protein